MSVPSEVYVLIGLSLLQLIERIFYYGVTWMMKVSKSKCVATVGKGCLCIDGELERVTEGQIRNEEDKLHDMK